MESKLSILLTFCTIFCIHYNIPRVNAVIGPTVREAEDNEFLYIVSFLRNSPPFTNPLESHFCTGTLITRQHVLSAARCTTYTRHNETAILAGTSNLHYGLVHYVQWWINYVEWAQERHRTYHMNKNDLSVTMLDREADPYIPAAMLSPILADRLAGRDALVIGWGKRIDGHIPEKLQIGSVKFLSRGICGERISVLDDREVTIDSRYLCTVGDPFAVMMEGDFGGPVMIGDYLVGVNKETRPFANAYFDRRKINMHMNINYYRTFINAVLSPDFHWVTPIA